MQIMIGPSPVRNGDAVCRQQVVPTIVLVLNVLPLLGQITFIVTQSLLQARQVAGPCLSTTIESTRGFSRRSTLSRGTYLEPPREERGADKLPCPLAGVTTIVRQLITSIQADDVC